MPTAAMRNGVMEILLNKSPPIEVYSRDKTRKAIKRQKFGFSVIIAK
tara:strand:+ start:20370 stop:20510 length:141 start_codon:yes stop_codon:yes gene_type:complete